MHNKVANSSFFSSTRLANLSNISPLSWIDTFPHSFWEFFAILTAIGINTKSLLVFVLSLILALMVLENRMEDNKKSSSEVIFGCCMGVLIVLLVYGLTVFKL